MSLEEDCAEKAVQIIRDAGGEVSWYEYDCLASKVNFFAPLSWCEGWGYPTLLRRNIEKLAVFEAVSRGLVEAVDGGYRVSNKHS